MMRSQPTGAMMQEAAALTAQGYRRTSNKYGIVARIERPDWKERLAAHLERSVAELYAPGKPERVAAGWCDYYRRVLSGDRKTLDPALAALVPTSTGDDCGFVQPPKKEGSATTEPGDWGYPRVD